MLEDIKKSLLEMDKIEAGFLAQQISKIMDKNRYKLLVNRDGTLTSLGEVVAQIFELVFVFGVLKLDYDGGEEDV